MGTDNTDETKAICVGISLLLNPLCGCAWELVGNALKSSSVFIRAHPWFKISFGLRLRCSTKNQPVWHDETGSENLTPRRHDRHVRTRFKNHSGVAFVAAWRENVFARLDELGASAMSTDDAPHPHKPRNPTGLSWPRYRLDGQVDELRQRR